MDLSRVFGVLGDLRGARDNRRWVVPLRGWTPQ